jgi:hypothetical protein
MNQTMIPVGGDYCTVAWAAELAGVSIRTVDRAIRDELLSATRPRTASRESDRHKTMLHTAQVREWVAARKLIRREDARGCE